MADDSILKNVVMIIIVSEVINLQWFINLIYIFDFIIFPFWLLQIIISMEKQIKHKHHIIPKHMGGSDDPENIVELSVEDHALAHKALYEKYGKLEDKIAWKCLSGKTEEGEKLRQKLSTEKFKEYIKDPIKKKDWKDKISNTLTGKNLKKEHRESISKGNLLAWKEGRRIYVKPDIEVLRKNWHNKREKMAEGRRNSKTWHDAVRSEESSIIKRNSSPKSTGVVVNGVPYASIRYAAKMIGIPYNRMRNLYLKHGKVFTTL